MKKVLIITILAIFVSSCKENETPSERRRDVRDSYRNDAIANGDDFIYGSYMEYADNDSLPYEKLSVSLIVNHKHKLVKSYYGVYRNMIELYNSNRYKADYLENLDSVPRYFALYYLIEGAKKGHISSRVALEKIYRNGFGIPKDSIRADSIYKVLERSSLGDFYKRNRNNKSKVDVID